VIVVIVAGAAYLVAALVATARFARRRTRHAPAQPGVTVLKPIHGLEAELFENLCSFCDQSYPHFQVVFGVARADDPAIEIIRRVIEHFPEADLTLAVGERAASGNPKVANVVNMVAHAKHDLLFVADADMRVDRHYVASVAGEFTDERVGAATCLYGALARGGAASTLGAMQLNDQFAPSVLVATLTAPPRYCFGSTMAVRRAALDAIGGFAALAPYVADDYMLGALVSAHGYRVALSRYVVYDVVAEADLSSLLHHELRWARTIRSVRPLGYAFSFVTFPLPFALLWVALGITNGSAWIALAVILALRVSLHYAVRRALALRESLPPALIPLRDCLGLAVWAAGLFGKTVRWRGRRVSL